MHRFRLAVTFSPGGRQVLGPCAVYDRSSVKRRHKKAETG